MGVRLYTPIDTPKAFAPDLWLIDGPAIRFAGLPYTTRATVIRLPAGALWVHSPTRLTDGLASDLAALGTVGHLIAPNWIHYAYLPEWQAAFPKALLWAAPGVAARAEARGTRLRIDRELTDTAPPDWHGTIKQIVVAGSAVHREAVFFHRPSRTLILTDLIENFEPARLPLWMRPLVRLAGIAAPKGRMPPDMRATFRDRAALRASVETLLGWAPERIVLSHGRPFEQNGTDELRRAFAFALR
jgi:hypothetical protein